MFACLTERNPLAVPGGQEEHEGRGQGQQDHGADVHEAVDDGPAPDTEREGQVGEGLLAASVVLDVLHGGLIHDVPTNMHAVLSGVKVGLVFVEL